MNNQSPTIEERLADLARMSVVQLRELWRKEHQGPPPKAFGPDLLRRSIAYKIQEQAYGGLDRPTAKLLNQLVAQAFKNKGKLIVPRRLRPGTVLVREWKGTSHRVTVAQSGFDYDHRNYGNLSEIARLITGTRWNGPRFFGLRGTVDARDD